MSPSEFQKFVSLLVKQLESNWIASCVKSGVMAREERLLGTVLDFSEASTTTFNDENWK